jgi:hypothetical protein
MKTPRQEQPWYESRLANNKKPGLITFEERTILTEENRRLIEQSAQIIAWGITKGWIAYPEPIERRIWKIPQLSHPKGSSIDPTPES